MRPPRVISAVLGGLTLLPVGIGLGFDLVALARLAVLGAALGQLVHSDVRERRIPNRIVLPAAGACAALSLLEGVRLNSLIGGGVLLAVMLAMSLARPAWLGMGDVKLALLLLCGLHAATPQAILFAVELCAVVAVLFILWRGREAFRVALPLAPFMAAGSLLALLI
jgi:leader peptidase (prepilin peptidase)/N-methyltransferase